MRKTWGKVKHCFPRRKRDRHEPQPLAPDTTPASHSASSTANPATPEPQAVPRESEAPAKEKVPPRRDVARTAKGGLIIALELVEKALDGLPIPGAKGAVGLIVKIIRDIDKYNANAETLKQLEDDIRFCHEALQRVSGLDEKEVPVGLKADLVKLVSELNELAEVWSTRAERGGFRRFIDANQDEMDLSGFSNDIKRAVERFQVSGNISGQLSHARMEAQIEVNEMSAVMRDRAKLVNDIPRAGKAGFNSNRLGGPSTCFAGTRVAILDVIKKWLESDNATEPRVFWLSGLAGIGKSTIAKTISEYARDHGILGGSFFFSRGDQALSDPTLVFPTLAFQLAQVDLIFKSSIGEALEKNPDYGHEAAPTQLDKLIVGPLSTLGPSKRILLLVLDALDELASEQKASEILQLFLANASRVPFLFRVLLTSRPEHHIRSVFDKAHNYERCILHDVEESVVQSDIHLYVKANLIDVPERLGVGVAMGWPKDNDLEALVEKSGKLFVYAATAIRFIGNDRKRNPQRQLEVLLGVRQATNAKPYAHLDQLYLQVLRNALPEDSEDEDIDRFLWVVGSIVLLRDPLSMSALARFTPYDPSDISHTLYHLHSIIVVPTSPHEAPHVYHPSFPDFIMDPERCTDPRFTVVVPTQEEHLVLRCLELMTNELKRDIAGIGDYSLLNEDIINLKDLVDDALPREVQYSCLYWGSHLVKVERGNRSVMDKLDDFVSHRLLNWFEAMSLLGMTSLAISSMRDAHQWAVESHSKEHLTKLLYDGYRFLLSHEVVIRKSSLHVYRSALPFTPHDTLLYKTYEREADDALRVLHGVSPQWSPCLSAINALYGEVVSVAYSQDGLYFATGCTVGKVIVWDGMSVVRVMTFDHPGTISSVVFLPDNTRLVSASDSGTVWQWDVLSGVRVRSYDGHSDAVNSLSLCSKTGYLASASTDATIRVWDTTSGTCVATIHCHGHPVFSILFLPDDDSRLLSGSADGTIRMWDIKTGNVLKTFEGHTKAVLCLAVSVDGLRFASGSDDLTVKVFSLTGDSQILTLEGHKEPVRCVAFSPCDGSRLVSGANDRFMNIWSCNTDTGWLVAQPRGFVNGLAFSPDGTQIVAASSDGTLRLWDANAPPPLIDPDDHADWVMTVTFSRDGVLLATGGNERTVKLWDATLGNHIKTLHGHSWAVHSLDFSPDRSKLASGSGDLTVRVWDVESGASLLVFGGHDVGIKQVKFSDNGLQLISRTSNSTRIWDLAETERTPTIITEKNPDASTTLSSFSEGFNFGMGDEHWVWMSTLGDEDRRVGAILEEYRISGFDFHSDRVVFTCIDGPVLILDISRLKKEFIAFG